MKKIKRFLALAGAVLLGLLYLSTLIFALIGSDTSYLLFQASVAATIIIPILLYGFILVAHVIDRREEGQEHHPDDNNLAG